jgi:Second Messenger Oligonucleotide or Dinucleotide Synthetase domain
MTIHDPIRPNRNSLALPSPGDAMLMDVARRVQISPTKQNEAEQHFQALCSYVDRVGSPLEGMVVACYPGGSFATGTAIASSVSKDQHDVDVVIELDIAATSDPMRTLQLLFEAINSAPGSRYHGRVKLNSRCVTVHYDDGVHVDLMPIARLSATPEKAGNLFHSKPQSGESYHKRVNPWGFAEHFNAQTAYDPVFAAMFEARSMASEGVIAKADVEPLPAQVPLTEKSARVVALQLIKRNRDVRFRNRGKRKPPSIVLSAMALDVAPTGGGLLQEVVSISAHIARRLQERAIHNLCIEVRNPSFLPDIFTDRWPHDLASQNEYVRDLEHLVRQLARLRHENISLTESKTILDDLFGETPAKYAINELMERSRLEMGKGTMRFGPTGKVHVGATVAAAIATNCTPARASTNMGGGWLPD